MRKNIRNENDADTQRGGNQGGNCGFSPRSLQNWLFVQTGSQISQVRSMFSMVYRAAVHRPRYNRSAADEGVMYSASPPM